MCLDDVFGTGVSPLGPIHNSQCVWLSIPVPVIGSIIGIKCRSAGSPDSFTTVSCISTLLLFASSLDIDQRFFNLNVSTMFGVKSSYGQMTLDPQQWHLFSSGSLHWLWRMWLYTFSDIHSLVPGDVTLADINKNRRVPNNNSTQESPNCVNISRHVLYPSSYPTHRYFPVLECSRGRKAIVCGCSHHDWLG